MRRTYEVLVFGILMLVAIFGINFLDNTTQDMKFLSERPPNFSGYFVLRSLFALVLSITVVAFINLCRESTLYNLSPEGISKIGFVVASGAIFIMVLAGLTLVFSAGLFSYFAREDSLYEQVSAGALFVSCGFLVVSALYASRKMRRWDIKFFLIMIFAFILFIIGMEEISWMQRIFKVATPSWFQENNIQKELNLHNLATSTSENLFYAGSFVLLVIYPVISYGSSIWKNAMSLAFLVPSRYVVVIGALSTTFSYEMWNIFWMQIAFFLALAILFEFARHAARLRNWADSGLFTAAFFTLFFVQIIDLSFGSAMIRHWDDTEFKELIIAIGLCYYAFEIGFKIRLTRPVKLNTNRGG